MNKEITPLELRAVLPKFATILQITWFKFGAYLIKLEDLLIGFDLYENKPD